MNAREEFELLLETSLAGKLTPDERARLKNVISSDEALRAEYLIALSQEVALKSILLKPANTARPRKLPPLRNFWRTSLAACALLAVGVLLYLACRPHAGVRVSEGLQALYTFNEGAGGAVRDVANAGAPLDLVIANPSAANWIRGGGLEIRGDATLSPMMPASKLLHAARTSNALTVEAWIKPAPIEAETQRYLLTLHGGPGVRLMEVTQHGGAGKADWQINFEMAVANANHHVDTPAFVAGPKASASAELTHLIFTRDATGLAVVYVNGVEQSRAQTRGSLALWGDGHFLTLGSDGSKRVWNGEFHLVAFYDRALNPAEVKKNFDAGVH